MQDAKNIEAQMTERLDNVEARVAAAEEHRKITTARREAAHTEVAKFQLLGEMFGIAQKLLVQRGEQFQQAEQQPPPAVMRGLIAAQQELVKLVEQVREHAVRNEGALNALAAMDEALKESGERAAAQGRGIETASQRALDLAQRADEPQGLIKGVLGELAGTDKDSAKEPIAGPKKKKAAGKRAPRPKD